MACLFFGMTVRRPFLLLLPFALALSGVGATAQPSADDWARCRGDGADAVIAGCTAVLGGSGLTDGERDEALSIRAFAYRFKRDYPHAIADYQEALRLNPRAIWAHSGLGKAYGASGDLQRAIGEYDIALGLAENELGGAGPQSAEYARRLARIGQILYDRGGAYEQVHNDARAMQDYRDGMRRVPQNADLGNALCWILAIRGESLDEARSACDRSLRIRPDHPPTLDSRGLVGLKQRRFQDAWNDYDAAVRLQPRGPSWLYGRGIAALRLGRTEEGRADIAAAVALNDGVTQYYVELGIRP
jgi:tetratricopeptide (TPR) repeat protein